MQKDHRADGSTFALAADVTWAMMHKKCGEDPRSHGTCRLNMQLCIDSFTPVELSISGADEGSEPAAFAKAILPDVIFCLTVSRHNRLQQRV